MKCRPVFTATVHDRRIQTVKNVGKNDPNEWSPFWQAPTITSFGDLFPNNYDGTILDFWHDQLTGNYDHVVDLACGNGALTWICDRRLNENGVRTRITGVDFAAIDPFRVLGKNPEEYPGVEFLGDTPIEALPFQDDSIGLAVSQYGIEYSDLEKSIPEVARVLSPTGKVSLILHDIDSVLIAGAVEHLDDFRRVLDTLRLHELALELDALHYSFDSEETLAASEDFQDVMRRIRLTAGKVDDLLHTHPPKSPLATYVSRLNDAFKRGSPFRSKERKARIEDAHHRLRAHVERIEDLTDAALDKQGLERLIALLQEHGLSITENRVLGYREEPNVGTALVAVAGFPEPRGGA